MFSKRLMKLEASIPALETLDTSHLSNDEIPSSPPSPEGVDVYGLYNPTEMKLPYCPIFVIPRDNSTKEYTALINSMITSPTEYFGLVEIINRMQEGDDMILNISSPGGYVCSATFIASSIYRCKGTVTTVATSICASAGSLIWSSGHICKAHPTAQFMYHMSSQMSVGNSVRIRDSANVQVKYVQEVLLDLAKNKGHITEAEVDLICKDPDKCVWIDAKKMMERIANHIASGEK